NPCGSSPCKNNGTCQSGFTKKGYHCLCRRGWTGERCQDGSSGLANARPPGRAKFANAPPPGLRAGKCPAVARGGGGGGWARLELTDALTTAFGNIVSHRSQKSIACSLKEDTIYSTTSEFVKVSSDSSRKVTLVTALRMSNREGLNTIGLPGSVSIFPKRDGVVLLKNDDTELWTFDIPQVTLFFLFQRNG
ncbi:unnamed protein product, partial [Porites lobata]